MIYYFSVYWRKIFRLQLQFSGSIASTTETSSLRYSLIRSHDTNLEFAVPCPKKIVRRKTPPITKDEISCKTPLQEIHCPRAAWKHQNYYRETNTQEEEEIQKWRKKRIPPKKIQWRKKELRMSKLYRCTQYSLMINPTTFKMAVAWSWSRWLGPWSWKPSLDHYQSSSLPVSMEPAWLHLEFVQLVRMEHEEPVGSVEVTSFWLLVGSSCRLVSLVDIQKKSPCCLIQRSRFVHGWISWIVVEYASSWGARWGLDDIPGDNQQKDPSCPSWMNRRVQDRVASKERSQCVVDLLAFRWSPWDLAGHYYEGHGGLWVVV